MNDDLSTSLERYVFPKKTQRIKLFFSFVTEHKQQLKLGVAMTCYLTLFLACFSVIFNRFYKHNEEY